MLHQHLLDDFTAGIFVQSLLAKDMKLLERLAEIKILREFLGKAVN